MALTAERGHTISLKLVIQVAAWLLSSSLEHLHEAITPLGGSLKMLCMTSFI